MRTTIKYKLLTAVVLIFIALPGCKKEFLDVNENPNNPTTVDLKFILPSAQANLAYTIGNQLQVVGGLWSQYWTQGPNANQYNDYDRYFFNNTDADRPWQQLYSGSLKDLDALYQAAEGKKEYNYSAVALILRAYTMQLITDAWGDVPFTEALKGFEGNTTPKYDSQESIYDALIPMIDLAISKMDPNLSSPGVDDLIYQGDMDLWYKFANTLKLKIYLRQVKVRPGITAAGIAGMSTDPTEYLENGEDAMTHYTDSKFSQNPLQTTVTALSPAKNIFASKTSVDYLSSINDPRIEDFYDQNQGGSYVGIIQGGARDVTLYPPPTNDNNYSQYNSEEVIATTVPVYLMSASESMFLQAEAIARGYMAGDAGGMYDAAIEDSWGQWIVSSAAIATDLPTYLTQTGVAYPSGGSLDNQVKAIITQKWIAMNGNQNFESWTEWRRTGYPDFLPTSVTSDFGPGIFPGRLVYSSDELTANPNTVKGLTVTDRVWWDVN